MRSKRKLPVEFLFKHAHTRPEIRELFFQELSRGDIDLFALVVDKSQWDSSYLRHSKGMDRIVDGIAKLVASMPDAFVDGQVLLVDVQKSENAVANQIRSRIRHELLQSERTSFGKVKAVPDHHSEGFLVQVADMAAGALSSAEWLSERCPQQLRSKIQLI